MKTIFIFARTALILSLLAAPAQAFKCESGTGTIFSPAECNCKGTADCKDMRKSKMCKGNLDCKKGVCTCTAAALMPADDGGEIKGRKARKNLPVTPLLNAQ